MTTLIQRLRQMADLTGLDDCAVKFVPMSELEREKASRQAAQIENEDLKARIARSGVEQQRAVLAERDACANVCDARYMGDNNREDMEARRCAEAIRARGAAPQPAIPPGYKLAPVEPTPEMMRAAFLALESEGLPTTRWMRDTYRAMLNAAPTPPAPAVEGETK